MQLFWYRTFPRLTFFARRLVGANYEREMELLDVLCDPAATGVDVGAKVGMYTYRIRAASADVVAFEPNPLFSDMLKAVFEGKRGRIEPFAVSSTRGKVMLRMPFNKQGSPEFGRSTIDAGNKLDHEIVGSVQELEVETRTLDDYALPKVGFIKIDVEGHEVAVLEGGVETLRAHKPNLLVECNDDHQAGGVAKLGAWLDAHDYDAYFVAGQELLPIARYERAAHWDQHFIENFIGLHRTRPEMHERLAARVRSVRMGKVAR